MLLSLSIRPAQAAPVLNASQGHVNFYKHTISSDDTYTSNPTSADITFMNTHWPRLMTYSPFWDNKLAWFPNAWVYQDSYAIYSDPSNSFWANIVATHPDWILKDASGNKLYINYACSGGTCTQYAANITNPNGFRAWWITQAQLHFSGSTLYKGLFIDDVNLDLSRVSDGFGNPTVPIDPTTGQPMTNEAWRSYFADFMQQVRAALPNIEIVHNALWVISDNSDSNIQREIQAADWFNFERGVNDPGLTGGTGYWSYDRLLNVADNVHANGAGVVFDTESDNTETDIAREYSIASFLLISNGKDMVGDTIESPTNWYAGFDTDLGSAQGARYMWNSLYRRDFAGGIALVNPPQANSVTVTLPGTYTRVNGAVVTAITLGPTQGAILKSACRSLSFVGGSATPATVAPNGPYTVLCDYGATVQGIGPTVGTGSCNWVQFVGTSAQYSCTAGSVAGTFPVTCNATAGTPDNLCPQSNPINSIQVGSACDVNADGVVNIFDVQAEVNMALGLSACINPSKTCNISSVQKVINAALGKTCVTP